MIENITIFLSFNVVNTCLAFLDAKLNQILVTFCFELFLISIKMIDKTDLTFFLNSFLLRACLKNDKHQVKSN